MGKKINLTLKVWRQKNADTDGVFERYKIKDIDTNMSFLEMLDVVNADIERAGGDPIAFDHDCREGICGMCGAVVNGQAHGPDNATTLCQLHMRRFKSGDTVVIEPFRAAAFPVASLVATTPRNGGNAVYSSCQQQTSRFVSVIPNASPSVVGVTSLYCGGKLNEKAPT